MNGTYEFSGITDEDLIEGFARHIGIPVRRSPESYTKKHLVALVNAETEFNRSLILQMYANQNHDEESASEKDGEASVQDTLKDLTEGFVITKREDFDKLLYQAKRTSADSNFNPHSDLCRQKKQFAQGEQDEGNDSGSQNGATGKEGTKTPPETGTKTSKKKGADSKGAPAEASKTAKENHSDAPEGEASGNTGSQNPDHEPTEEERLAMEKQSEYDALHDPNKGLRVPSGKKPGGQEGAKGSGIKLPEGAERQDESLAVPERCLTCPYIKDCFDEADVSSRKNFIDIKFEAKIYPFRVVDRDDCPLKKKNESSAAQSSDVKASGEGRDAPDSKAETKSTENPDTGDSKENQESAPPYTLIMPEYLTSLKPAPIAEATVHWGDREWKACIVSPELVERFRLMKDAVFSKPVGTNQYGPEVEAVILRDICILMSSYGRSQETLSDAFDLSVSTGTYDKTLKKYGTAVVSVVNSIRRVMLAVEEIVNCDGTGINVNGKNNWIHAVCTEAYTFMEVQEKRGKEGILACGFLNYFTGIVISDCWSAYFNINDGITHGLCNEHILRELTALKKFFYNCEEWSQDMINLLLEMKKRRDELEKLGYRKMPSDERNSYRKRYENLLNKALELFPAPLATGKKGRPKNGKARNLILRMQDKEDAVLLFLDNFDVPFTNNKAERAFRLISSKKGEVGCFRTIEGARNFVAIWSYLSTAKKQGHSYVEALEALTHGRAYQLIFPRGEEAAIEEAKAKAAARQAEREKAEAAAIARDAAAKSLQQRNDNVKEAV